MNYESFHPVDKYTEKPNDNIIKRFFTKINNPIPEKKNDAIQKIPKLIKNEISVSAETLNKEKISEENIKQNSKQIYLSKRHSADYIQDKMSLTKLIKSVKVNLQSTLLENQEKCSSLERIDRGYWMPDSICRKCYSCEEEFTTIKRKHHCRMCGQIFCYRCCIDELPGSLWNLSKPQRSCRMCFISYNSQNRTKFLSSREGRSFHNSVHNRSSKSNISPRGSIASETVIIEENLSTINKNLSFSSNDIQYLKDNGDTYSEFESEEDDSKKNLSEIEKINNDFKYKIPDRKQSIYKSFFPSHILSRDKLFGTKISGITNTSNINEFGSNQDKYKQELLSIWKLIINETEKCRLNYFTKIKVQKQTRQMEQQFSFPNTEEDSFLPIIFKEQDSSKSCIDGHFLIDWIVKNSEISDVYRATAICQSYLEMQLLSPYFDQDNKKLFKYDGTLYVIREFTADYSPQVKCNNQFFNETDRTGYNNVKKNFGNSVFYVDYDNMSSIVNLNQEDESLERNPIPAFLKIKSPTFIKAEFANNINDINLEDSIFQKNETNIWNRSCRYLERLLKQELHDYNLDISWCNIILPICKLLSEKICPPDIGDRLISDIRNFIQIKKIPNSSKNDCRVFYSVSMSKNIDYPMKKEIKNPKVILIRSSIDYWRHKKLVSFDPLLLQEEEYLKNCVIKIKYLEPDIVVVEGSVALSAKEMMENCGLLLVSNVRKEQIERLSRMLGATIFDSVDSLGTNVQSLLGKCSQFSVQKYTLTNGRNKTLLFFKLFNPKHGCTIVLHGKSLSELVRVKYVTKFILLAFKNAYFELALLKNFKIRFLPLKSQIMLDSPGKSNEKFMDSNKSSIPTTPSTFMEIIENRCIAMSVNVIYDSPKAVLRSSSNPEFQNRLLSLEIINLSWKEKLNDVIKRKQRHICAELYDVARMNIRKHPLLYEPQFHAFTNTFYNKDLNNKEQCILYTDFRKNGSRFHPVNDDIEDSIISTVNFDSSDLACKLGFLTKSQEIKWRTSEKKKIIVFILSTAKSQKEIDG